MKQIRPMDYTRLFRGDTLPPPAEYEDGDMYLVFSTGELYAHVGGSWVLVGSGAVLTNAQNVGTGTGLVYRDITSGTLNFRTLKNNDGSLIINTSGDEVNIDLQTSGPSAPITDAQNVGGGSIEVYRDKTGNTLNFRTIQSVSNNYDLIRQSGDLIEVEGLNDTGAGSPLIAGDDGNDILIKGLESSSGSVVITDTSATLDLDVDLAAAGGVVNGQNVGTTTTGTGEVFAGKSGTNLLFRRLNNDLGSPGYGVLRGTVGNDVILKRLKAGTGISISDFGGYLELSSSSKDFTLIDEVYVSGTANRDGISGNYWTGTGWTGTINWPSISYSDWIILVAYWRDFNAGYRNIEGIVEYNNNRLMSYLNVDPQTMYDDRVWATRFLNGVSAVAIFGAPGTKTIRFFMRGTSTGTVNVKMYLGIWRLS